jgi:hypothetical protein
MSTVQKWLDMIKSDVTEEKESISENDIFYP